MRIYFKSWCLIKKLTESEGDSRFVDAFIPALLISCIGVAVIIGPIQDGLPGDYTISDTKSTLNLFVTMILIVTNDKESIFYAEAWVLF